MSKPDPEIARQTAEQRRATADMLAHLETAQWSQPSRCEGWSIHHLVAHLTLPFTSRGTRVVKEVVKARGSFDTAAGRMAREDAHRYAPAELVQIMRDNLNHPWSPPGGGPVGALSHDVIHSYDVTDALGLTSVVSPERATTVLRAFKPSHLKAFDRDLTTMRFISTDPAPDGDCVAIGAQAGQAEVIVAKPLVELIPYVTGRRPV